MSGEARAHEAERTPEVPAKSEAAPKHGSPSSPAGSSPPPPGSPDAVLTLQRIAGNRATSQALGGDWGSVAGLSNGFGTPLAPVLRDEMEQRFGVPFGEVRIHVGREAEAAARAVDAAAYTCGSHIVFGRGAYAPATAFGRTVIAHELAHVVQQGRGGASPIDSPGSGLERAATASAGAVVGGSGAVHVAGASAPGLARLTVEEARKMLAGPLPEWMKRPAREFLAKHQTLVDYVAPPQMELSKPVERFVEKARHVEDIVFGPPAPASTAPATVKPSEPVKASAPPTTATPAQKFDESVKKALSGEAQVPTEVDSGIWVEDPALIEAMASTPDGEELLDEMLRERERKRLAPLRQPVDPNAFKGVTYDNDPHLSNEGVKEGKPYKSGFYWVFPVVKQDTQTVVRYKLYNPQADRVEWVVGQDEMKALWNDAPGVFGSGGYTVEEWMYDRAQMIYGNRKELRPYEVSAARGEIWNSNKQAYQDPNFYQQTIENSAQLIAAGTKPPPLARGLVRAAKRGGRWVRGATAAVKIGTAEATGLGGGAATASFETASSSEVVQSGGATTAAGGKVAVAESAPAAAAAAETAPAQNVPRAPRTTAQKAQAVQQGLGSGYVSSGGSAEETVRRAGDPALRVQGRSSGLELHTANRYLKNGSPTGKQVLSMESVPSRAGSRTPDYIVTYVDGTVERIECVTVTSAPRGRVANTVDLAKASAERPPSAGDIRGAIQSKAANTPAKPSQLASEIPDRPDVPPRGAIVVNVVNGGSRQMADQAVSGISADLGAHVQRIEVTYLERVGDASSPLLRKTATYVRDSSGRFVPMTP